MMHILLAIGSAEIGGGQNVFLWTINEYIKRNLQIDVVIPNGPLCELLKTQPVRIHKLEYSNSLFALIRIILIMKKTKPDLINTYLTKCSILFSIINIVFRIPICCTLLNAIVHEKLFPYQRMIYPHLYFILAKLCDGLILNSYENKEHFIKIARIDAHKIHVIHSGLDLDKFCFIPEKKWNSRKLIIGTVGRLSPEKGHIYMLKALDYLRNIDYEYHIVGDGYLRKELEEEVNKRNLRDKVKFFGFVDDVLEYTNRIDIIVLPSINDAFPITILEAFALKKIVVASHVGGIPELVKDKITGYLCPARDSVALGKAILYIYNNINDMEKIKNNAYNDLKQNYSCAAMADKTIIYYDKILNKHKIDSEAYK